MSCPDAGIEYTVDIVHLGGELARYEIRRGGVLVMRVSPRRAEIFEHHFRLYVPPWKLLSDHDRARRVDDACADWICGIRAA